MNFVRNCKVCGEPFEVALDKRTQLRCDKCKFTHYKQTHKIKRESMTHQFTRIKRYLKDKGLTKHGEYIADTVIRLLKK